MSERPMHQVPGLFQQLKQLYAEGEARAMEGQFEQAAECFTQGIELDDQFRQRYVTFYAQRAFAWHRMGRLNEAIADYTKAIELEPEINQAQYYFQRGMARASLGQHTLALSDYSEAIARHQEQPGPYHLRGKLLVDAFERYAEALPDFDRLLELRPNAEGFQYRGLCKVQLGNHAEAQEDLRKSVELRPSHYCEYLLACCAAALKDPAEMYEHMQRALAEDPSYAEYFRQDAEFEPYRGEARFERLVS